MSRVGGLEWGVLASGGVEVARFKPALEAGALCRPFVIEQRIPGGVTVAAFVNDGLAEGAFVGEAEALGGAAAGRMQKMSWPCNRGSTVRAF